MKFIEKNDLVHLTMKDGGIFKSDNLTSAYDFCKKITTSHYENFPVASLLIPSHFRKNIFAVYAFARIADDIADELTGDNNLRVEYLKNMNDLLCDNSFNINLPGNPIFMALHDTLTERNIPILPFQKLLEAFKRDILFKQADEFDDLEEYCTFSANPIGEIVLRVFNCYNAQTATLSDKICTGLQLVNFWQDLSIDLKNSRCYIPTQILHKFELTKDNLYVHKNSAKLLNCLEYIYKYTDKFFVEGYELIKYLNYYRLKVEIRASLFGGLKILNKLKKSGPEVLYNRPALKKIDFMYILFNSLIKF